MAKKKKLNLLKTGSEVGLLVIHVIQEIFRQIDKYGPEVVKLIAKTLRFLGKWGSTGIKSLRAYLDREEKRLSAANMPKSAKAKKATTSTKRKTAKKKKAKAVKEE